MKLTSFLKSKLLYIILQILLLLFILIVFAAIHYNIYANVLIIISALCINSIVLGQEFLTKRTYYNELLNLFEELDKKCLISEVIEDANFLEGQILYYVLCGSNKSMNDEIAKYNKDAKEYKEFIETWVHEIKTPIAGAKLIIENNKNKVTERIDEELHKIDSFVEQALYYTRSNHVEKDYVIKNVMLKDVVNNAIKRNARQLIEHRIAIELGQLDYSVYSDEKWLAFILNQIIVNSIKYCSGVNDKLKFNARQNEQNIVLQISDHGIGIPQKDIGRLFEKGFTGENGRQYSKSTGLGLYLVKKLCDKLGIDIRIHSDNGVSVQIIFPIGTLHQL